MNEYETPNLDNAVYLCQYFGLERPDTTSRWEKGRISTFFRFPCSEFQARKILGEMPAVYKDHMKQRKVLKSLIQYDEK